MTASTDADMGAPTANLKQVSASSGNADRLAFWLSEPEIIDDSGGEWGFAVYADKDVFLATFTYPSQDAAIRARDFMIPALKDAIFIATAES